MIFTRRFGALAARPVFPAVVETKLEQTVDRQVADTDIDQTAGECAA